MDNLHKLAQEIADEAYETEFKFGNGSVGIASAVYHYVYQTIVDNAEEIAAALPFSASLVDDGIKANMLDVITVIDAHNDLHDALEDIAKFARREPENPDDAIAIILDVLERAEEALNG